MRVFTASLATETNTFAPSPTGMAAFREGGYFPAGSHPPHLTLFSGPLWAAREQAPDRGWTLIEGLVAFAQPGGVTTAAAWHQLKEELLADLRAAMPVQIVLLGLHGAMVADGCDDCEGELLRAVRDIVGPDVVVGAELDPHHHLSEAMCRHANLLVSFKEYPHTDVLARGHELVDLCADAAAGRTHPVIGVADCHMISIVHTSREPARSFVDRLQALEGHDGVLSISVTHGFPWGDVPDMGSRVFVYTDGEVEQAQALARRLADELVGLRDQLQPPQPDIDAAIDQALACLSEPVPAGASAGPVVLADGADNPGGGAAGDSTFILRRLLERQVGGAALGPLWDPQVVHLAFEAGVGATLDLRLGGKTSPLSGDPVDARCTVLALQSDLSMSGLAGTRVAMGDCALLQIDGVQVVVVTRRNQAMGSDLFTQLGCDLHQRGLVVVKSSQHFYASFAPLSRRVIYVAAPGTVTADLCSLPYRKADRGLWPLSTT
jgi:microcystin degradation protein MlrC